ncbi:MAG: hypothetical protein HOY71_35410 [Nonomuraea sp.]|nr:hypothetical protein [Nonomuraea sp.]
MGFLRMAGAVGFALSVLGSSPALADTSRSDLQVVRMDPDATTPGGLTTVHAFVANRGPDRTASPFTVVVTLPDGAVPEGPFFPANCRLFPAQSRVRCTFPAGLAPLRTATALIPVRIDAGVEAPATLSGGRVEVRSRDDGNPADNCQPFDIRVGL